MMKNLRIKYLKRQFTNWDVFRFTSYDRIYVSKIQSVWHHYTTRHTSAAFVPLLDPSWLSPFRMTKKQIPELVRDDIFS